MSGFPFVVHQASFLEGLLHSEGEGSKQLNADFRSKGILENLGKVESPDFGGIVKPTWNGKSFFHCFCRMDASPGIRVG